MNDQNKTKAELIKELDELRKTLAAKQDKESVSISSPAGNLSALFDFIEKTTAIVAFLEADGKIKYLSPELERIIGYTSVELKSLPSFTLTHPEDKEKIMAHYNELILNPGVPYKSQIRIHTKNGNYIWTEATRVNLLNNKSFNAIVSHFQAIQDWKDNEFKLQSSEFQYKSLFNNMLNGMAFCKILLEDGEPADFMYLEVNNAFEELTGLKNVVGKKISELVPELLTADKELIMAYGRVALTGNPEKLEVFVQALNDWYSISVYSPEKDYFIAVFDVITERKNVEDELLESKTTLQTAMESMSDAVFISDKDGKFIQFNEAFAIFHKFKSKDECSKTLEEYPNFLDVMNPEGEVLPLEKWAVPRALRGEIVNNAEYYLRRRDTGESWIGSYNFAPIRDSEGNIRGSVVTGTDITKRN